MTTHFLLASGLTALLLAACGEDSANDQRQASSQGAKIVDAAEKQPSAPAEAAERVDAPDQSAGQPVPDDAAQEPKPTEKASKPVRRPRLNMPVLKALLGMSPAAPKPEVESTPELIALGKALYHDQQLSAAGDVSCATCHDLKSYGVSAGGKAAQKRDIPSTYNAFLQFRQGWDGRAGTVEELAAVHATDKSGNGLADEAALVAKIKAQPELTAAFGKAFGGGDDTVTAKNFGNAVGAFLRTLTTPSRWDDFLGDSRDALTNEELQGLKVFMDLNCTQCHMTRLLGGNMYQKLGVYKPYTGEDLGRMQVTGNEAEKYMFKVPSLLNVAKTAPYYHDGSVKTLEEAVRDMAKSQLDKDIDDEQVASLVAFLNALTGKLPAAAQDK